MQSYYGGNYPRALYQSIQIAPPERRGGLNDIERKERVRGLLQQPLLMEHGGVLCRDCGAETDRQLTGELAQERVDLAAYQQAHRTVTGTALRIQLDVLDWQARQHDEQLQRLRKRVQHNAQYLGGLDWELGQQSPSNASCFHRDGASISSAECEGAAMDLYLQGGAEELAAMRGELRFLHSRHKLFPLFSRIFVCEGNTSYALLNGQHVSFEGRDRLGEGHELLGCLALHMQALAYLSVSGVGEGGLFDGGGASWRLMPLRGRLLVLLEGPRASGGISASAHPLTPPPPVVVETLTLPARGGAGSGRSAQRAALFLYASLFLASLPFLQESSVPLPASLLAILPCPDAPPLMLTRLLGALQEGGCNLTGHQQALIIQLALGLLLGLPLGWEHPFEEDDYVLPQAPSPASHAPHFDQVLQLVVESRSVAGVRGRGIMLNCLASPELMQTLLLGLLKLLNVLLLQP